MTTPLLSHDTELDGEGGWDKVQKEGGLNEPHINAEPESNGVGRRGGGRSVVEKSWLNLPPPLSGLIVPNSDFGAY